MDLPNMTRSVVIDLKIQYWEKNLQKLSHKHIAFLDIRKEVKTANVTLVMKKVLIVLSVVLSLIAVNGESLKDQMDNFSLIKHLVRLNP